MRVRMVDGCHKNPFKMLLVNAQEKSMRNILWLSREWMNKIKNNKCTCNEEARVEGECLWGKEYETPGVIYKIICKCYNQYYLGKPRERFQKEVPRGLLESR